MKQLFKTLRTSISVKKFLIRLILNQSEVIKAKDMKIKALKNLVLDERTRNNKLTNQYIKRIKSLEKTKETKNIVLDTKGLASVELRYV